MELAVLQGLWEGFRWFLRALPFIVVFAVIIVIWRFYRKSQNVKEAKHLLEIKSTDTTEINRVISELSDYKKGIGQHDESIEVLIQKLRQLRDNPPQRDLG